MGVFNVPNDSLQLIFDTQTSVWAVQCMVHYAVFFLDTLLLSHFQAFRSSYQEYVDKYRVDVV